MKIVTVVLTMALIVFLGSCVENIFHYGCDNTVCKIQGGRKWLM